MEIEQLIRLLSRELSEPREGIHGHTLLAELPEWDSMSVLGVIASLDEEHSVRIDAARLSACKTVTDLWELANEGKS